MFLRLDSAIFWDVVPCNMMDIYWHRIRTSISRLDFYPEKWKQQVPLKCWICTRLNVVTSYETLLFVLKTDIHIAVNHNTFYQSHQHILHVVVILTILRHDDVSLASCNNICRIYLIVVYCIKNWWMHCRKPQYTLLVPSTHATCFSHTDHPQAWWCKLHHL